MVAQIYSSPARHYDFSAAGDGGEGLDNVSFPDGYRVELIERA